jgi:alpha-ketoglutarate-dependent taurine dioxygenase
MSDYTINPMTRHETGAEIIGLDLWDDRSVMHQANGDYDMKEIRHLYRIMVEDDPRAWHWIAEGDKTFARAAA